MDREDWEFLILAWGEMGPGGVVVLSGMALQSSTGRRTASPEVGLNIS